MLFQQRHVPHRFYHYMRTSALNFKFTRSVGGEHAGTTALVGLDYSQIATKCYRCQPIDSNSRCFVIAMLAAASILTTASSWWLYLGTWSGRGVVGRPTSRGHRFAGSASAEGLREGIGLEVFPNGNRYAGTFTADVRDGVGTLTFKTGSKYEGEFKNGLPSGTGMLRGANGAGDDTTRLSPNDRSCRSSLVETYRWLKT
jgi:hypothetical protein